MNFKELDIKCDNIDILTGEITESFEPIYYYHTNPDTKKVRVFIFQDLRSYAGEFSVTIIIEHEENDKYHIEIITSGGKSSGVEIKTVNKVVDFILSKSNVLK